MFATLKPKKRTSKVSGLFTGKFLIFLHERWFLFVTFFYVYGYPALQQITKFVPYYYLDFMLRSHLAISFTLYVVGFIAFIVTLEKDYYRYQFGQLTWTLMTLMLVVGQSNFVIRNILKGMFWY
jgi:phosphatidate cytidylyltransferase